MNLRSIIAMQTAAVQRRFLRVEKMIAVIARAKQCVICPIKGTVRSLDKLGMTR